MSIPGTLPMRSNKITRGRSPHILDVLFPLYAFAQPFVYALVGATFKKPLHQDYKKSKLNKPFNTLMPVARHQMESFFVDALVQAASYRPHARLPSRNVSFTEPTYTYHRTRRRHTHSTLRQTRRLHCSPMLAQPPPGEALVSREECIQMLDYYEFYGRSSSTLALGVTPEEPPIVKLDSPTKDPVTSHEQSSLQMLENCAHEERSAIQNLMVILRDENGRHEAIYEAYCALPSPRVSCLPYDICRLLLRRLSIIERKNKEAMLRYLSVVDDMKAADLPLKESEWNSAIAYAGRCFARVQATEVETALRMWKEMEQKAGVQSGKVTFNILFDVAAKAGKYVLAEMILKEMEVRKLKLNRYARVGFIYYHGLKGDGQGVRMAYRDFVESGGIIDTVVMNCVIASLIRAGELSAAEQVYERMKQMLSKKTGAVVPSMDWKATRELGRVLDKLARVHEADAERLQQIRNEQYLGPNLHTFAIFIDHHATETGELRRIAALLDEMQMLGVPMHGRIFLKIFKGFAHHGGVRYTSWTKARLEGVWNSLRSVLKQDLQDVHVMKWMVVWAIRAFQKCCGRQRTLEIWEELKTMWEPDVRELETVEHILGKVLRPQNDPEDRDDQERDEP